MANLNEVRLIGNVGKPIELRNPNGTDVCTVFLATNSYRGKGEQREQRTAWHRVVLFDQNARYAARHVQVGDTVFAAGHLDYRQWERDGEVYHTTEIIADDFQGLRLRGVERSANDNGEEE
ncbi:single-stranded DNA-binding protein (plasmid) [Xanthomonas translucens pv. translucens]|uniref:single-stranded DNA-binding protein n=1 Tax=Xanthomonas TaxID=338 RepID=UPI0019D6F1C0|nr:MULTISPECIES: single-stranded DNA-binding protein [Xanthomonas]MCT8309204.1 single-stranded DNA-binding protein [Xanthomonas translucens pv. translucens]QSQ62278.1 single-stranded DNA-binding protein [Xanthomonas translucens pv. undulosa]WCI07371.1 single-stranded DNA-binding protein [Xanthomonas hortorum pv. pelargonii]WNJ25306.1 single-stranded DNA-binding protein [Xanthomonas translucens pv. translucens]WNJ25353.1 single-stranded DNA-binding protein [Xanthomonas translucens pv. transluce